MAYDPQADEKLNFETSENVNFKVSTYKDLKNIRRGDLVAKLEIYGQNGLILSENLYSIIDR